MKRIRVLLGEAKFPMVGKSLLRIAELYSALFGICAECNSAIRLRLIVLCLCAGAVQGRTLYVDGGNRDPEAPYTNWTMAADSIQDAIDAAVDGDVVLVTNGTYFTGYTTWNSDMRTRVVVSNAITLRSVNGAEVTTIRGLGPSGPTAVRCVYLVSNAVLEGFTLQDGHTRLTGDLETEQCGGGVWSDHAGGVVSNCYIVDCNANEAGGGARGGAFYDTVFTNCQAKSGGAAYNGNLTRCQVLNCRALTGNGGGTFGGTFDRCLFKENRSEQGEGGGTYGGIVYYCEFRANYADFKGGGAAGAWVRNCVFIGNTALIGGGVSDRPFYDPTVYDCTFIRNRAVAGGVSCMLNVVRCVLMENEASYGSDNVYYGWATHCVISDNYMDYDYNYALNPMLAGVDNPHLLAASPVIDFLYVTNYYSTYDIDGEARINGGGYIDMGCDEYWPLGMTGELSAVVSLYEPDVSVGFNARFEGTVYGKPETIWWNWGDGQITSNLCMASHCYTSPGNYEVVFGGRNLDGSTAATVSVHVVTIFTNYVSLTGNHTPPFSSWANAATTVQDAVDAQLYPGGVVMLADGVYSVGETVATGECPNRVALTNKVVLRSLNGPGSCVIQGSGPLGKDGVRCLFVGNDAVVDGLTIENGHTWTNDSLYADVRGGGAYCERHGVLTNCVIRSCKSGENGGGVYWGTVYNSTIVSNEASPNIKGGGGGIAKSMLFNCSVNYNQAFFGGGGYLGKGSDNTFVANRSNYGGGGGSCALRQSLISRNIAYVEGGGQSLGALENCVVVDNQASEGGGVSGVHLKNSIVYYNTAILNDPDFLDDADYPEPVYNSCLPVIPLKGSGNITNEPGLCGLSNPHILQGSFCRNAGTNLNWMINAVDIDGESRLEGSRVDIGCDEYHAAGVTGPVAVAISLGASKVVAGYPLVFEAATTGRIERLEWNFDDGTVVTNSFLLTHVFSSVGTYDVVLSAFYDGGSVASTAAVEVVGGFTNYVSRTGLGVSPYTSWATAARKVQDAVDANGTAGGIVMVGPGTYDSGGVKHRGCIITSRVVLAEGMKLISSDGPESTIIEGITNEGPAAVRCVYLGDDAEISGFTLKDGGTSINGGWLDDCSGAGVLGKLGTVVSNCWIDNCHARQQGGGAALVSLYESRLTGCSASNGAGIYNGTLSGCLLQSNSATFAGGATYGTLVNVSTMEYNYAAVDGGAMIYGSAKETEFNENRSGSSGGACYHVDLAGCTLYSNIATSAAGGSYHGTASNCVYLRNGAKGHGGAAYYGTYYNCSFVANTAGVAGVGDYLSMYDCEVVSNSADVAGAIFEGYAERCVFKYNSARLLAGANYGGTNVNCWLTGNYSGREGGAAYGTVFENCTIVSNAAADIGGGLSGGSCLNSIVRYNYVSLTEVNYAGTLFDYSFTSPMPNTGDNYTDDPGIVGWDNPRLLSNSPCINTGFVTNWMTNAVDLYGEARLSDGAVDVGCSEFHASARTGALSVVVFASPSRVIAGNPVKFIAVIDGQPLGLNWDFGGLASEDLLFNPAQSFGVEGTHDVVLQVWNEDGLFAVTSQIYVAGGFTNYVAPGGGNISPYTNWATAANSLQDAITANDVAGGVIMVSNGVYNAGSLEVTNGMDNRVVVTNPVVIRSVNGPAVTVIEGRGPLGALGIRCLYMVSGSELHGFTVTNGHTHLLGDPETELRGGGIWCEDSSVLISNCVISGCGASSRAGGVYRGHIKNSLLNGNSVVWYGGASHMSDLEDCVVADNSSDWGGGGLSEGSARRCIIRGNKALGDVGGGSYYSSIYNCQLYSNEAFLAGGIYLGSAYHCTIVSNWARDGGGGSYDTSLRNCIVYYNQANSGEQNVEHGLFGSTKYSCTTPLKSGTGNITNAPLFENPGAFDLRIQTNSPCIDAGRIEYQTADDYLQIPRPLDGNDDGTALPDMGAYEFICDAADSDGDFYRDGDEFVAGTDPVDPDSYFEMLAPLVSVDDIIMQWQTATGRLYTVMRSTNLSEGVWADVAGFVDLPGDGGMLTITNSAASGATEFYRVEVEKQ